jgi:hypothetical protein
MKESIMVYKGSRVRFIDIRLKRIVNEVTNMN